jgi:hypothetical protein
MEINRSGKRFKIKHKYTSSKVGCLEWQNVETILARLVARAYAADHPELFYHDSSTHTNKPREDADP